MKLGRIIVTLMIVLGCVFMIQAQKTESSELNELFSKKKKKGDEIAYKPFKKSKIAADEGFPGFSSCVQKCREILICQAILKLPNCPDKPKNCQCKVSTLDLHETEEEQPQEIEEESESSFAETGFSTRCTAECSIYWTCKARGAWNGKQHGGNCPYPRGCSCNKFFEDEEVEEEQSQEVEEESESSFAETGFSTRCTAECSIYWTCRAKGAWDGKQHGGNCPYPRGCSCNKFFEDAEVGQEIAVSSEEEQAAPKAVVAMGEEGSDVSFAEAGFSTKCTAECSIYWTCRAKGAWDGKQHGGNCPYPRGCSCNRFFEDEEEEQSQEIEEESESSFAETGFSTKCTAECSIYWTCKARGAWNGKQHGGNCPYPRGCSCNKFFEDESDEQILARAEVASQSDVSNTKEGIMTTELSRSRICDDRCRSYLGCLQYDTHDTCKSHLGTCVCLIIRPSFLLKSQDMSKIAKKVENLSTPAEESIAAPEEEKEVQDAPKDEEVIEPPKKSGFIKCLGGCAKYRLCKIFSKNCNRPSGCKC